MGKPVLGENCRLEVIIEESYDFKVIFRGLPFLESCLSRFRGEGPRGVNGESHREGGPRVRDRPPGPSISTMDSTPPPLLPACCWNGGVEG